MKHKKFIAATYNANSIRSRIGIVTDWLKTYAPDVLCIQETKVVDDQFPKELFLELGYHVIFRGQKSYNGVAIVSKKAASNIRYGFDDGGQADESRLISALFGDIHIVNTYVPQGTAPDSPNFQYKLDWFGRLKKFFSSNFTPFSKLIWMGDLNIAPTPIDVYDPQELLGHVCYHPEVHKALQTLMEWGFTDVFRMHHPEPNQYTFWDYRIPNALKRKMGWRIDHIMATTSIANLCVDSLIDIEPRLKEKPSDHTFLWATFELK